MGQQARHVLWQPGTRPVAERRSACADTCRRCGENLLHLAGSTGRVLPAYKENTIRSFREAVALGCNFIEFDVQVTADNVPVIFHDDHVSTVLEPSLHSPLAR